MKTGERIKNYRIKQGLTQRTLGESCGIAESTIRRYELGSLNPKIETLKKIADALGVPVADLAGWSAFDDQYPHLADEVKLLDLAKKIDANTFKLNELFSQLNDSGKAKAVDALSDLAMIEKYTQKK